MLKALAVAVAILLCPAAAFAQDRTSSASRTELLEALRPYQLPAPEANEAYWTGVRRAWGHIVMSRQFSGEELCGLLRDAIAADPSAMRLNTMLGHYFGGTPLPEPIETCALQLWRTVVYPRIERLAQRARTSAELDQLALLPRSTLGLQMLCLPGPNPRGGPGCNNAADFALTYLRERSQTLRRAEQQTARTATAAREAERAQRTRSVAAGTTIGDLRFTAITGTDTPNPGYEMRVYRGNYRPALHVICRTGQRITFWQQTHVTAEPVRVFGEREYSYQSVGRARYGFSLGEQYYRAPEGTRNFGFRFVRPGVACDEVTLCQPIAALRRASDVQGHFLGSSSRLGYTITGYYATIRLDLASGPMARMLQLCRL